MSLTMTPSYSCYILYIPPAKCMESPYQCHRFASPMVEIYVNVCIRPLTLFEKTSDKHLMVGHHLCPVLLSHFFSRVLISTITPKAVVWRIWVHHIQLCAIAVCKSPFDTISHLVGHILTCMFQNENVWIFHISLLKIIFDIWYILSKRISPLTCSTKQHGCSVWTSNEIHRRLFLPRYDWLAGGIYVRNLSPSSATLTHTGPQLCLDRNYWSPYDQLGNGFVRLLDCSRVFFGQATLS